MAIENIKDLKLDEIEFPKPGDKSSLEEFYSKIDAKLQEHLNINLSTMKKSLTKYVEENASKISLNVPCLAPDNDYSKLLEDNDSIAEYLQKEGTKPDQYFLLNVAEDNKIKHLLKFQFYMPQINKGESLFGYVFVSKTGAIRHAFVQSED